jgi:hypothetical protein
LPLGSVIGFFCDRPPGIAAGCGNLDLSFWVFGPVYFISQKILKFFYGPRKKFEFGRICGFWTLGENLNF